MPAYVAGGCGIALFLLYVSAAFEPSRARPLDVDFFSDLPPLDIIILLSSYGCISLLLSRVSLYDSRISLFSKCHVREVVIFTLLGEVQSMHFFQGDSVFIAFQGDFLISIAFICIVLLNYSLSSIFFYARSPLL